MAGKGGELRYRHLAEELKSRIGKRELVPGAPFPTVDALRSRTGFARNTILTALRHLAEEGYIEKGPSKRHGYRVAAELPRGVFAGDAGVSSVEAIMPFEYWNYVGANLLGALEEACSQRGANLVFSNHRNSLDEEGRLLRRVLDRPAGSIETLVLMTARSYGNPHRELLQEVSRRVRLILLDRRIDGVEASSVGVDNRELGYRATGHLLRTGHKRVAIISGFDRLSTSRDRYLGYISALYTAGIPLDQDLVSIADSSAATERTLSADALRDFGRNAARRLLSQASPPDALFCTSDKTAAGVIDVLRNRGLHMSGDFAVVSCDDDRLISEALGVVPTGFAYPYGDIAAQILHLANEKQAVSPRCVEFAPRFVEGATA